METVNERISAVNCGTWGPLGFLFTPLQASGTITDNDCENMLGCYIEVDVDITAAESPYETYTGRTIWNRLGTSHDRIYRIVISDAVSRVITRAFVDAEITNRTVKNPNAITWDRLGQSRDRVYRIVITNAVKRVISRAFVEAE